MPVVFGLLAALSFGISDLFLPKASRAEGSLRTLFYTQIFGGALVGIVILLTKPSDFLKVMTFPGLIAICIGLVMGLGYALLIRSFELGPLMLVSPISSSFAAFTVLLSIFISKETPSLFQSIGLILVLTGIVLASISTDAKRSIKFLDSGVILSLFSALLIGLAFWLLRFVVVELGSQLSVFLMRISAFIFLTLYFLVTKRSSKLTHKSSLKWLLLIGALNTGASLFYNWGLSIGLTSVVSVITSLYSVITIILAYLFLSQKITRFQALGMLVTLLGIGFVSI